MIPSINVRDDAGLGHANLHLPLDAGALVAHPLQAEPCQRDPFKPAKHAAEFLRAGDVGGLERVTEHQLGAGMGHDLPASEPTVAEYLSDGHQQRQSASSRGTAAALKQPQNR